ncbi:hypothetical protein CPC08DRAFT_713116 [Agrocybe pediades]|nr:hypothetical protein CPC08DRAFT_713116 [Agrocybe pediades]
MRNVCAVRGSRDLEETSRKRRSLLYSSLGRFCFNLSSLGLCGVSLDVGVTVPRTPTHIGSLTTACERYQWKRAHEELGRVDMDLTV